MDTGLQELFDYCQIPESGQKYIEKYYKEQALNAFYNNRDEFKYLNFISLIAKFGVNVKERPYNYLYHYLFKNDLIQILKSGQFYIGKQDDMNDPQEHYFTMQRMRVWLLSKYKGQTNLVDDRFQDLFFKTPYWTYLWSFTTDRNSQAMQRYGDTCIRVDSKRVYDDLMESCTNFKKGQRDTVPLTPPLLMPLKVCYDNNVINDYTEYLADAFSRYFEEDNEAGMQEIIDFLKFYSMIFKNSILKEEKEIRFVLNRPIFTSKKPYDIEVSKKYKLIGKITPENLTSIIVNHQTDTWYQGKQINTIDDTIRDLRYVVQECGFKQTRISKTQLPY